MRWQRLFDDLESQAEGAEAAGTATEVAERTRREAGRVRLVDRLRASVGAALVLRTRGGLVVTGRLVDVGADWLLLEDAAGEALVPLAAVLALAGAGRGARPAEAIGEVESRYDLRFALRRLVRDRSAVEVVLDDGTAVTGTLDRVAADHVELAQHPLEAARRSRDVQQVLLLPLPAITAVRRG